MLTVQQKNLESTRSESPLYRTDEQQEISFVFATPFQLAGILKVASTGLIERVKIKPSENNARVEPSRAAARALYRLSAVACSCILA